jgi:hypothetical protein
MGSANDGGVEDHPLLIVNHEAGVHGAIDMALKLVLAKHQAEVPLPSGVGSGGVIKDHRDTLMDVQIANDGDVRTGEGVGGGGGSWGAHDAGEVRWERRWLGGAADRETQQSGQQLGNSSDRDSTAAIGTS